MESKELIDACCRFLDDMKADDIEVIELDDHSLFDAFIVATCTSLRHLKSTANAVMFECKKQLSLHSRSEVSQDWVAVDLGRLVVHLFLEDKRVHYDLESLWLKKNSDNTSVERIPQWETKRHWDL